MTNKKPTREFKRGAVKAAIWRNEGEKGAFFTATFNRVYRSGNTWKSTQSFGIRHLEPLALLVNDVQAWMLGEPTK